MIFGGGLGEGSLEMIMCHGSLVDDISDLGAETSEQKAQVFPCDHRRFFPCDCFGFLVLFSERQK